MSITEADLQAARVAWGDGLVAIAKAYEADGIDGARAVASDVIDAAYGYGLGPVLFKPTMASGDQTFRPTRAGALSYFVGHDPDFPHDGGFLANAWKEVRFESTAGPIPDSGGPGFKDMGQYTFVNAQGEGTRADYTFAYHKVNGRVLISLHHSSLTWEPA